MNANRQTIEAAGYTYPINWDEMGSSAKDRWEETRLKEINTGGMGPAAVAKRAQGRKAELRRALYARDFSALTRGVASQGAADYCAEDGHAVLVEHCAVRNICPRCLAVTTEPVRPITPDADQARILAALATLDDLSQAAVDHGDDALADTLNDAYHAVERFRIIPKRGRPIKDSPRA